MKLSYKIIIIIFIGTLLLVSISSVFVYFSARSDFQKLVSESNLELAHQTMDKIDRFLVERYRDVRVIAESKPVIAYILKSELSASSSEDYILLEKSKKEASDRINGFKKTFEVWDEISVFSLQGSSIISTDETEINENLNEEDYKSFFSQALKGEVAYSSLFLDKRTNMPIMIFLAPIRSELNGEIIGIIEAHLNWPMVLEIVESINQPIEAKLYDNNGLFIGSNNADEQKNIFDNIKANEKKFLTKEQFSEMFKDDGGDNFLISHAPELGFLGYKGNDWHLILKIPTNIVFAPVQEVTRSLLLIIFIIGTFTAFLTVLFIYRIVLKPILYLTKVSKKIAAGDLSQKIKIKSKDEIGQLGFVFNEMIKKIKESHEGLEDRVSERTEELFDKIKIIEEKNKKLEDVKKAMVNLMEDINAEKKIIAQDKAKDEALLEGIGDGVVATDESGKVIYMNKAAEEMLGWKSEEVIGKFYYEILKIENEKGKEIKQEMRPINIALSSGVKVVVGVAKDYYYKRRDNSRFPVAITIAPVVLNDKIIGAIDVFRDIAHEKDIDRAKTEFVSLASHQLRTPLSAINWYTEMLLAGDVGKVSDDQKQYLEEIYHGSKRLVELVNSLLNVSRLELGTFAVEPKPINVIELVDNMNKDFAQLIKNKKLKLKTIYDKDLPIINADPQLLRIIFENLLSNAIKYTPESGNIKIEIKKTDFDILVTVSDTGCGIPENQQKSIFTKLFRADNVVDMEGTGLGLYIAKAILEKNGGKIWFESKVGEGTTFYFTIPLAGMKKRVGTKELSSSTY